MKNYYFLITLMFLALLISCNTKTENVTNIDEGKYLIEQRLNELKIKYENLCGGVRNDQVKGKFGMLQTELRSLNELGYKFEMLSYDDQLVLLKYANEQIAKNPSLNTLMNNATVDCW